MRLVRLSVPVAVWHFGRLERGKAAAVQLAQKLPKLAFGHGERGAGRELPKHLKCGALRFVILRPDGELVVKAGRGHGLLLPGLRELHAPADSPFAIVLAAISLPVARAPELAPTVHRDRPHGSQTPENQRDRRQDVIGARIGERRSRSLATRFALVWP
jgi:hypothetical protein